MRRFTHIYYSVKCESSAPEGRQTSTRNYCDRAMRVCRVVWCSARRLWCAEVERLEECLSSTHSSHRLMTAALKAVIVFARRRPSMKVVVVVVVVVAEQKVWKWILQSLRRLFPIPMARNSMSGRCPMWKRSWQKLKINFFLIPSTQQQKYPLKSLTIGRLCSFVPRRAASVRLLLFAFEHQIHVDVIVGWIHRLGDHKLLLFLLLQSRSVKL